MNCESLESIDVPDSVTEIRSNAFNGCAKMTELPFSDAVICIGSQALHNTPWLDAQADGLVLARKVAYTYKGDMIENTALTLPDGIIGIANGAFYYQRNLTSVTVPDGVRHIDAYAFMGCSNLSEVKLPQSIDYIGSYTFSKCSELESFTIPGSVTAIKPNTFDGCSKLESITIPRSVTSIDGTAFLNCDKLKTVYGYLGTYGEKYAKYRRWTFIPIRDDGSVIIKGDLSGNGSIEVDDVTTVQKVISELVESTPELEYAADVNKDGKTDISDATLIQKYIAEMVDSL